MLIGEEIGDLYQSCHKSAFVFVYLYYFFIGPMCTWGPIIGEQCTSQTFLKHFEDLVKTVNVVNVVKI